ncbi:MAG: exodeoxyribonuclease VII large subunit, partial [Eubacteriales bacterium]
GVVTSQTGAAIRDIIHVARRRNPNVGIVVSPCLVQGPGAAADIVRAMDRLNRAKACDVMLVGRGGGSIEDLWAFNEEVVARAIAASPIPVVSCVGHEVDFTISDFVADLRAPTPSAAAELTVPRLDQLKADMDGMVARLAGALRSGQRVRRLALERLTASTVLTSPGRTLIEPRLNQLEAIERRLCKVMPARLERCRHRLDALSASLRALDPASVMDRGYAVVRQEGHIVPRATLANGELPLRVCFSDGELLADITAIESKDGHR